MKQLISGLLIAVFCLSSISLNAQNYKKETYQNDPMNVIHYTLDNGLQVFMSVNKDEPRIQTLIAVRVGSKNDPAESTGLSHYLEHLMFKGTSKFGTLDWAKEQVQLKEIERLYEVYNHTTDPAKRKAIYHLIDSVSYEASKYAIPNEYDKLMSVIGSLYVGPRINAAGRMKSGKESVRLFIVEDEDKSADIGNTINTQNEARKEKDRNATEEAIQTIRTSHEYEKRKSIVIYNPNWFKGIIGIVASRLVEEFYKPTIVLTRSSNGLITGSARSVKEFNIYEGIDSCSDLLEDFGGHKFAAGLSMKEENLEEFTERFEQFVAENLDEDAYIPEINVDLPLDLSEITPGFVANLNRFAPFGPGNMAPVFQTNGVVEDGSGKVVGNKGKHIKMRVLYPDKATVPFDGIGYNLNEKFDLITNKKKFDIVYHVEENTWNNKTTIQLNIKDIRASEQ